ncbi:MAG: hypothetical protein AB2L11_11485 [Syntrophobacteraceae bacterium]
MNIQIRCANSPACVNRLIPILFLALFLSVPLLGCGKKILPKEISQEPVPQVKDLQVLVRAKGVEVSWSIPEEMRAGAKSQYRFSLFKSQLKWDNRNCLDCPTGSRQEVLQVDPAYPEPARIENNKIVWTDIVVSKQNAYRYQVSVHEKRGRQLSISNAVIAKVVPAPLPIKDLQVNADQRGIMVQWKTTGKNEKSEPVQGDLQFILERQTPGGVWDKALPVPLKANNYLDKSVASNQLYNYRVTPELVFEGTLIVGETSESLQVQAHGAVAPPPPKAVWVIPTKGNLEVHWTESEGKPGGYHVYRREGKEIIRLTSSPVKKPPFVDQTVKKNALYSYAVSAVNMAPEEQEGLASKWVEIRSLLFE